MVTIEIFRTSNPSGPKRVLRSARKTVSVGGAPNCTVCLKDAAVSPLHCAISWKPGTGWSLMRHRSAAGLWVDGIPVDACPLRGGEEIQIGDFTLIFHEPHAVPTSHEEMEPGRTDAVESASAPRACLIIESGATPGRRQPLSGDITVIGRGEECDVVLDDQHCSRNHAEIQLVGQAFMLRDLGSLNGVLVNDTRVDADRELRPGDVIRMGGSVIRFVATPADDAPKVSDVEPVDVPSLPRPIRISRRRTARSASSQGWSFVLPLAVLAGITAGVFLARRSPSPPKNTPRRAAEQVAVARPQPRPRRPGDQPTPAPLSSPPAPADDTPADDPKASVAPRGSLGDLLADTSAPEEQAAVDASDREAAVAQRAPAAPTPSLAASAAAAPAPQSGDQAMNPKTARSEPAPVRLAVPGSAEIDAACEEVLAAYADDLSGSAGPTDVIRRLVEDARESERPASKFALLLVAERAALQARAYRQVAEVIDVRGGMFDVDALSARFSMLDEASKSLGGEDDDDAFATVVDTVQSAVRQGRFDVASRGAALAGRIAVVIEQNELQRQAAPQRALPMAAKGNAPAGRRDVATVGMQQRAFLEIPPSQRGEFAAAAAARLRRVVTEAKSWHRKYVGVIDGDSSSAADPKSLSVVGRYQCFVQQDWRLGLRSLAAGRDDELHDLAARELAALRDGGNVARLFEVAGAWWEFAEVHKPATELPSWSGHSSRAHAADIYQDIVDKLADPVDERLARRRIEGLLEAGDVFGVMTGPLDE